MATATATENKVSAETTAKNKLRLQAERRVLEAHQDEFNQVAEELFTEAGYTFRPRLTKTQRAEAKARKLLAENPELAKSLGITVADAGEAEDADNDE